MLATSLKKITDGNLKRNKLRVLCCIFAVIFSVALTIVEPFLSNAYFYYSDLVGYYNEYYDGYYIEYSPSYNNSNSGQMRANECRDAVYADLCMLGTVYLSNCENGEYKGTADLYENLYATLSYFGDSEDPDGMENIFGLDKFSSRGVTINQSHYNIINIDSDYFYFYVAYGDEYLTNIDGVEQMPKNTINSSLVQATDNSYYYLRQNNTVSSVTPYKESGFGKTEVYYSSADGSGGKELTSEYIDSDKLMLGAAGKDNYNRYTFCFSNMGDMCINSWNSDYDIDEDNVGNIPDYIQLKDDDETASAYWHSYYDNDEGYYFGERRENISMSDPEYTKYVSILGGVYNNNGLWTEIDDIPGYTFEAIDTSKLTVFMSPKVDIVKSATTFTSKYQHKFKLYRGLGIAFSIGWAVSAVAFAVISLARPAKKYKSDTVTFGNRLFKLDFSIVALLASVLYIIANISSYSFYGFIIYISISGLALKSFGMLLANILGFLSIDGIIRQFKINGKAKPRLLIKSVIRKTAPVREKISELYARIPVVKTCRRAKLKTRYLIKSSLFIIPIILLLAAWLHSSVQGQEFILLSAVIFILYIIYVRKIIKDISKLEAQIDNMLTDGEVLSKSKSELKNKSLIYPLSEKLATISDKAEQAVEKQVQSEKMKVELVTNVSHDLKTPLTSIISYIDLLEKTELSDEAMDYVKILSRKSDKLRDIVADVFTLAKAVSGVEVESEELDFSILTRQVLADNSDKIETSGRDLRTDISVNAAPIIGDGAKLYRVIQNLLDNALKYSMEGTRIYLALSENNGEYELTVKNVSAYEMNFTAEEITERFTRGDKSRTDGGSGLGLAIAKSFTQACGGLFEIIIDGDVFNAAVTFHKRETSDTTINTDIEPIITADDVSE